MVFVRIENLFCSTAVYHFNLLWQFLSWHQKKRKVSSLTKGLRMKVIPEEARNKNMWRFYFTLRNWTLQIKDRVKGQLSFPKTVSHVHAKHGLDMGKCSSESRKWHSSMWFMVSDGSFEKLKHFDLWSFKFFCHFIPTLSTYMKLGQSSKQPTHSIPGNFFPNSIFQLLLGNPAIYSDQMKYTV